MTRRLTWLLVLALALLPSLAAADEVPLLPLLTPADLAELLQQFPAVTVTGTVAATQSGTWNITNVSGTVSLPTGASTAAKQPALGTAGSASTDVLTIQGIASMTKLLVTPDSVALPANQSVNVAQVAGTTTDTNSGNKSAGTQRVVLATDQPALTNALKVDGSAVTQPVSGSLTVTQGTGTNLHIVCDSGCSSSAGFADNSAFTYGTTAINPIGGVLDDVSTNTATENSAAIARITPQKALHVNFRNQAGTEIGTSSNPIQVSLANTGSNATAVSVDTEMPAAATLADATANPTVPGVASFNMCWNGATWDRCKTSALTEVAHDGALTPGSTVGNVPMWRGSAATPSAVSADDDAVMPWADKNGRPQVNINQINGVTPLMGNGVTGTGSPRVTIASDNTAFTVNAAESGTWTVQPGNTANTTAWIVQPVAGTTNGASTCVLQSAASTNATNCKASAGLLYGVEVINTTSTIYFLRLYNLSASPTCSSATGFVRTIPIPHGTGAGAGVANFYTVGETYGTGLGFCFTGGGTSTDNTNAATGVYITLHYK